MSQARVQARTALGAAQLLAHGAYSGMDLARHAPGWVGSGASWAHRACEQGQQELRDALSRVDHVLREISLLGP